MKAALYIRVSTHHQIDKDSLPFQRKELENYAQYALNIKDYEVFEDAGGVFLQKILIDLHFNKCLAGLETMNSHILLFGK